LSVAVADKKQPNHVEKIPEIQKNINLEVMTFFEKLPQNPQILKSRSRISSLGLGLKVLTRSQSQRLRP